MSMLITMGLHRPSLVPQVGLGTEPAHRTGTEPAQNRDSWWVTYTHTTALSRYNVVAHQVPSLLLFLLAGLRTEPVLYGSVCSSVSSRRRFCQFCISGTYSPSATRTRGRVCVNARGWPLGVRCAGRTELQNRSWWLCQVNRTW